MVNARSQVLSENRLEQSEDDQMSDNDDNVSVADQYRESYFDENDEGTMTSMERDHERLRIEQRFVNINRQLGELTSIVRAFTKKISNNIEGHTTNASNTGTSLRSDIE